MAAGPETRFRPVQVRTRAGTTVAVHEYSSPDFPALVEMYGSFEPKRVAQGLPPPDVPRITHWLDELQHKSRSLLALESERIVAHAVLCPISAAAVEFTIFVHQDYRGQGLGTALTRLALRFAGEMGFAEVYLATELSNLAAVRLYRKVGFRMKSAYGDECEMKIDLAQAAGEEPKAA
jgi:RimJ/RimL family protein N-acetyltransferase